LVVILPLAVITGLVLQEGFTLYGRVQSGELSFSRYVQQIFDALPTWLTSLLNRYGVTSLSELREALSAGITKGIQFFAAHAVSVGQNAFDLVVGFFLMLYLMFFFLRDGQRLARRIRQAVPLQEALERDLFSKFVDDHPCNDQGKHHRRRRTGHARRSDLLVHRDTRADTLGGADGFSFLVTRHRHRPRLAACRDLPAGCR
jgi:hypothetical protein